MTGPVRIEDVDGDPIEVEGIDEWVQVSICGGYVDLTEVMVDDLIAALRQAVPATTRPAHFEVVHSDVGHRVRLVGANGEVVLWSETYVNRADAHHAVELALLAEDAPVDVDERTGAQS